MLQTLIDLLYPPRCPICSDIVDRDKGICKECKLTLTYITEPRCKKCSKPIEYEEAEFCFDCSTKELSYTKGFALWLYEEPIKKSIYSFKFNNKREYANFYIKEIIKHYAKEIIKLNVDAIIPIPLHIKRFRERGYNQSDILAKGIGKALEIPVRTDIIKRVKYTQPQRNLSDKERIKNVEKAFQIETDDVQLRKILLIDDIYTTGTTIDSCARLLINKGVEEVYYISLCIGKGM